MHFLDMADPVWDVAILRDTMRKLQKEVHDLHWELAAVGVRMLQEICRLLPFEGWPAGHSNNNDVNNDDNNNNN